jgi:glycosyltransferase involved in cell wall biosynthesis
MRPSPRVSLILCVKNGQPYLPEAVRSVAVQSFRDFEVIVQDGGSTDGSLELLRRAPGLPAIDVVSEPDSGIGQAYNRALRRCRGAIIGSIDSDNLLEPDALEHVVAFFDRQPTCAALYGASSIIDSDGRVTGTFVPAAFDYLSLLRCELVPSFAAAFFCRAVCGAELTFDELLATCADYDLWLRLGQRDIQRTTRVLGSTRLSGRSMTCRPPTYDRFCADKITSLRRQFARLGPDPLLPGLERHCIAGIYTWAAESMARLDADPDRSNHYRKLAIESDRFFAQLALRDNQNALHHSQHHLEQTQQHLQQNQRELHLVRWQLEQHEKEVAHLRDLLHTAEHTWERRVRRGLRRMLPPSVRQFLKQYRW